MRATFPKGMPTDAEQYLRKIGHHPPRSRGDHPAPKIEVTDHRMRARLARTFRRAGYRFDDAGEALGRALCNSLPRVAGGAVGAGGVAFLSNLPADRFRMDPAAFEQYTERQDIPQPQQTFNGFGSSTSVRLQNVGVVSLVRLYVSLSLVVSGTGAVTSLGGWPYNLISRLAFNANGQTSILQCRGTTLRARRQRLFRNAADALQSATGVPTGVIANGTYPITFVLDVPISHDMLTGVGWMLAQNPSTSLSVDIAWANQSATASGDCFTIAAGGNVALTGTVFPLMTTFAIGTQNEGGQPVTVIPDLTVFHGLLDNDTAFTSSGIVQAPLIRTAGQLLNYFFTLINGAGNASEISPAGLTEIQFRYGGNRQPRVYNPPQHLLEENQRNYNGLVQINGYTHTFLDFEVDNPSRDLVLPEALVELTAQVTIPTSTTVNAGARLRSGQETLYPAV